MNYTTTTTNDNVTTNITNDNCWQQIPRGWWDHSA